MEAAQSFLPSSRENGSAALTRGWGWSPIPYESLDSASGGSLAHGHKTHSQHHLFHDEGDISALTLFTPLSYSQLIQNLGREEAADWASFKGSRDCDSHFTDKAWKNTELFPKEKTA